MKILYSREISLTSGEKIQVFLKKPSNSSIEKAEFFFSQKYNYFLQSGLLSKAMMEKKMGDVGGVYSTKAIEDLGGAFEQLLDSQRTIEFFEGAEDLSEDQARSLAEAKDTYLNIQYNINNFDNNVQEMYSHSADAKAQQELMRWYMLNHSYYYEKVDKDGEEKLESFLLFDGASYKDKLAIYHEFLDNVGDEDLERNNELAIAGLPFLNAILALWYNGNGDNQETLEAAYKDHFPEENKDEEKKKPAKKKTATKKKTVNGE